ncbi:hypothetical protein VTJ83DRAFT_5328 [Remersonia thermophila]|uniref:Uncharacterized protein n=1 Tax=Remersonia thermophila TaxID=72144 RepID=A0ABR4D6I4_9PEZI
MAGIHAQISQSGKPNQACELPSSIHIFDFSPPPTQLKQPSTCLAAAATARPPPATAALAAPAPAANKRVMT